MAELIRSLMRKYRELLLYGIFGVLTTALNILVYYLLRSAFPPDIAYKQLANAIAWLISVLFAYGTNRAFVFSQRANTPWGILRELLSFMAARLLTGGLDMGIMYVGLAVLHLYDMAVKVASNVLVIVLNYILSKFFIFKKEE